jgi:hypothetical protein
VGVTYLPCGQVNFVNPKTADGPQTQRTGRATRVSLEEIVGGYGRLALEVLGFLLYLGGYSSTIKKRI